MFDTMERTYSSVACDPCATLIQYQVWTLVFILYEEWHRSP
jgi:hypothetical protein